LNIKRIFAKKKMHKFMGLCKVFPKKKKRSLMGMCHYLIGVEVSYDGFHKKIRLKFCAETYLLLVQNT
jgi:hypothetical protein